MENSHHYDDEGNLECMQSHSDSPPAWFDPSYAGEHWNDDY